MKKVKKAIQTFIGSEATLEGKLVFEGTLLLDGHFTGSVESKKGTIIVSERGAIHADILVQTAIVSGEVNGNIRATERIELHPPARVLGDVSAPVVVIDAGVVFEGNCTAKPMDDSANKTIRLQPAP
jgi:cytoskeletal protein CcmA (bactofilin family)